MYAVMDPNGDFYTTAGSLDDALQAAAELAPLVQVEDDLSGDTGGLGGLGAGYAGPLIDLAQDACKIPTVTMDEVMALDLAQAAKTVRHFFPNERFVKKTRSYRRTRVYDDPIKMAKALLGQNYKTGKQDPNQTPSSVRGLSLLPAFELREYSKETQKERSKRAARLLPTFPSTPRNFCIGSTPACRKGCLVHSGHNDVDPYNVVTKIARSRALTEEPVAFLRLLTEAVGRFQAAGRRRGIEHFVRLNVFSDLPWELIFPDIFHAYPTLQFYDYTKVDGRDPEHYGITNYDLTFSNGGGNLDRVQGEVARGRRVATVFLPPKNVQASKRKYAEGLPIEWLGRAVVDGDVTDVRPRDPSDVVVGLRWKIPMGVNKEALAAALKTAFVLPVEDVGDGILCAPVTPLQEGIDDADDDFVENEED